MEPSEPSPKTQPKFELVVPLILIATIAIGHWALRQWNDRNQIAAIFEREPLWSIAASAHPHSTAFVRVQNTSFWMPVTHGLLTSSSTVATQNAAVHLTHSKNKSTVIIAPDSVVAFGKNQTRVLSGFALIQNTLHGSSGETLTLMEPRLGSTHDLQVSDRIEFAWPQAIHGPQLWLEFARESGFSAILFTQTTGSASSLSLPFSDRSPGAWFVRLRSKEKVLAVTAFNLTESETPDLLKKRGRRWLTWRDRAWAASYRIEFSTDEIFKNIAQSFEVLNREFDLSRVPAGRYFVRITAISIDRTEKTSRPLALDVQDKAEILRAGLEFNDPSLKLSARGWKIVLSPGEASRIREGYVILRESEIRGIKVADEVFGASTGKKSEDYMARMEILKSVVFELSRDESFSNVERVKPDSRGELLPPALPLGVLYARLRRIESDGTFGSAGPPSRLTTLLPSPVLLKTQPIVTDSRELEIELKWKIDTSVTGYELQVSSSREFPVENTTVVNSKSENRKMTINPKEDFYWKVTATNEFGQKVSMPSDIQHVRGYKPVERKLRAVAIKASPRDPAMTTPLAPSLQSPLEDAVIVGGATAKKYGKLKWQFDASAGFEVQIATDGDFVNIIEKAKIDKTEYTLQGDLPEGALFWRVRKLKTKQWSESRRFELVYE